jgi:hypothetical protein
LLRGADFARGGHAESDVALFGNRGFGRRLSASAERACIRSNLFEPKKRSACRQQ